MHLEPLHLKHKANNAQKLSTSKLILITMILIPLQPPSSEVDRCLLTVVTWSRANSSMLVNNPSVLLSSLDEYISLRRLQKTPLTTITLPQDISGSDVESTDSSHGHESISQDTPLFKKMRNFIMDRNSSNGGLGGSSKTDLSRKIVLKRYSSILKYGHKEDSEKEANATESTCVSNGSKGFTPLFTSETKSENADRDTSIHPTLKRSVSDGLALKQSLRMNRELSEEGKLSEGSGSDFDELSDSDAEDDADSATVRSGDPLSPAGKFFGL